MTREDLLEQYRSVRAAIQRTLREVSQVCRKTDLRRALSDIAPWVDDSQMEGEILDMMMDVALFERDRRGERGIDRCRKAAGKRLSAEDRALLERMTENRFSLFRVAERHEVAGLWLEDLLDDDRRIWVMDEGLEASASPNMILALRLFEPGPYHASFGIAVPSADETLGPCLAAKARRVVFPTDTSLAALVYGDHLAVATPVSEDDLDALKGLAELFLSDPSMLIEHERHPKRPETARRLPKPRKP